MDFVNRIASLSVIFAAFVLFIICQTSAARSISYYQSETPFDLSDSYLSFNQQQQEKEQYQQPFQYPQQQQQIQSQPPQTSSEEHQSESTVPQQQQQQQQQQQHQLAKRRLVVRVPFAQSPDEKFRLRLIRLIDNNNTKEKKFMSLQALL